MHIMLNQAEWDHKSNVWTGRDVAKVTRHITAPHDAYADTTMDICNTCCCCCCCCMYFISNQEGHINDWSLHSVSRNCGQKTKPEQDKGCNWPVISQYCPPPMLAHCSQATLIKRRNLDIVSIVPLSSCLSSFHQTVLIHLRFRAHHDEQMRSSRVIDFGQSVNQESMSGITGVTAGSN